MAGNAADLRSQVIAAAAGLNAGAAINADLIAADTEAALTAYRQMLATAFEAPAWEERYRSRPTVWSGRPNPSWSPRPPTSSRGGRWTWAAARAPTRCGWPSAGGG
ncbi:hypothetical protein GCM10027614_05400 [Micromonospora vulcania]